MLETAEPTQSRFAASAMEKRKQLIESVAKKVMLLAALALIVPVLAILAYIFYKASPLLSWAYIWGNPEDGGTAGGIWLPLIGTFYLVLVSLCICAPIGIMAGIYLNEYATDNWFTRIINMAVTSLAGVPSIVHALFGVGAFVLTFKMGASLIAASCTIAVMTIPVLITSTREALAAVPMPFREACWNMGATKWQTIRTIVLPNSISGILTGVILEVSRAAGETAPILFTGAAASIPFVAESFGDKIAPYYLGDKFMALSYHLHVVAEKLNDVPEEMKFGTAAVLIGLILIMNSFSISLRMFLRSRKKW
jgi:phosphate transport system permease protein